MIVEEIERPSPSSAGGEMPKFYQLNREREQDIVPYSHWQAGVERPSFWQRLGLISRAFWHSLHPRQLRRHITWAGIGSLLGRYAFWLGAAGLLGYYVYREQPFALSSDKGIASMASAAILPSPTTKPTNPENTATPPVAIEKPIVATSLPAVAVAANSSENEEAKALLATLDKIDPTRQQVFLQRFGKVAQDEMRKFDIPASVTLALAIAYSQFGTNPLSAEHNNFFAIACHEATSSMAAGENCFAQYENAWASFRAHSQLLQTEEYRELRQVAKGDYWVWALGLERIGYRNIGAGFSAEMLKLIIERYELTQYDK